MCDDETAEKVKSFAAVAKTVPRMLAERTPRSQIAVMFSSQDKKRFPE
jgi:hypothetical protein